MSLRDDVIGAWNLRDWLELKDGKPTGFPFGEGAEGQATFDASGRMSGLLQKGEWKDTDLASPEALASFFAYAGKWRIEDGRLITRVLFASFPHLIGADQVRTVAFEDDALVLEVLPEFDPSGLGRHQRLIWTRC